MNREEMAAQWVAETERIARLVKEEFMPLKEQQLAYRVHVSQCNIRQIMQQVVMNNSRLLEGIEHAIPSVTYRAQQEYLPGFMGRYLLNRMAAARCSRKESKGEEVDFKELSPEVLFLKITGQQNKFKELVTLCKTVDMNRRVVPFRMHGLIRLSIGETFDYLLLYQKRRFVMARHLVMLQGQGGWSREQEHGAGWRIEEDSVQ